MKYYYTIANKHKAYIKAEVKNYKVGLKLGDLTTQEILQELADYRGNPEHIPEKEAPIVAQIIADKLKLGTIPSNT